MTTLSTDVGCTKHGLNEPSPSPSINQQVLQENSWQFKCCLEP